MAKAAGPPYHILEFPERCFHCLRPYVGKARTAAESRASFELDEHGRQLHNSVRPTVQPTDLLQQQQEETTPTMSEKCSGSCEMCYAQECNMTKGHDAADRHNCKKEYCLDMAAVQIDSRTMKDIDLTQTVDNQEQSVVHADTRYLASILVPAGSGAPCTSCHALHSGDCSFHDLLQADMERLQMYADVFIPPGPECHSIRGALYTIMGNIHICLVQGGISTEVFRKLRVAVRCVIEQCNECMPSWFVK
jgi:hypothetical protein